MNMWIKIVILLYGAVSLWNLLWFVDRFWVNEEEDGKLMELKSGWTGKWRHPMLWYRTMLVVLALVLSLLWPLFLVASLIGPDGEEDE